MQPKDSFWITNTYKQQSDFLIIGNGFTGMQVALQLKLKYPQKTITIADQNYISNGASLRNAGFACFGSASELLDDIRTMNEEDVYHLVSLRYQGLKYLTEDFCNFDYQVGNAQEVFLPSETAQYQTCLDQLSEVNRKMETITGLKSTYKIQDQKINPNFKPKGIVNSLEGHLHTGKLYHQMQQKVIGLGIFWIGDFKVKQIKQQQGFEVHSENNEILTSKCVISCINANTTSLIPNAPIQPSRGQIIVTKPLRNNPLNGILHADKGYIYARDLGKQILIGGARNLDLKTENTIKFEENKLITQSLLNFVNEMLLTNESAEIEQTWSCIMGMSPKKGGLPIINEELPNYWSCYRLGGMGVALSSVIARKLAQLV